jgi:DNA-binding transcriptional ArsR family regulator
VRKARGAAYSPDPDVAGVAGLFGDPVRASILHALMDGRERSASELASRAGASPQAASAHLAKLGGGGLIVARAAGRQRLFKIASPDIGHAMEALAAIARPARVRALGQATAMQRLREARSCYDHLAGRIGVAVSDFFISGKLLEPLNAQYVVTRRGKAFFSSLEIDVETLRATRRSFARECIDWTERRPHVAGALGARLLDRFLDERWLVRNPCDRALALTPKGRSEFARRFNVRME